MYNGSPNLTIRRSLIAGNTVHGPDDGFESGAGVESDAAGPR